MRRLLMYLVSLGAISIPLTTFAAVNSDTITVTGAVGTAQAGLSWSGQITEAAGAEATENPISSSLSQAILTVLQGTVQPKDVYLTDPGTNNVSDLIRLTTILLQPDTLHDELVFTMTSDLNANLPATVPSGRTSIDETGLEQDITKLIFPAFFDASGNPINGGAPYTVVVSSDVEVPEPASLGLLAAGSLLLLIRQRS